MAPPGIRAAETFVPDGPSATLPRNYTEISQSFAFQGGFALRFAKVRIRAHPPPGVHSGQPAHHDLDTIVVRYLPPKGRVH